MGRRPKRQTAVEARGRSIELVKNLLNKQKLAENIVQGQDMSRHDIVESLVHRQHLAELDRVVSRLSAGEIGGILHNLPIDDSKLLWERIPPEREGDVLWELTEEIRERLAGNREPRFSEGQTNAFELVDIRRACRTQR